MRTTKIKSRLPAAATLAAGLALTGCGLEGLVSEAGDTEHQRPRTTLRGSVDPGSRMGAPIPFDLERARFEVLTADGREVEVFEQRVDGRAFDLALDEAFFPNARLSVTVGGLNLLALIPQIDEVDGESEFDAARNLVPTSVEVSRESTVEALVVMAKITSLGRSLQAIDPVSTGNTLALVRAQIEAGTSTLTRLAGVVDVLIERADSTAATATSTPVVFQWPVFQPEGQPLTRSIVEGSPVVEEGIDFGGFAPVSGNLARLRFDDLIADAAATIQIQECLDPDVTRAVFEVDFNPGKVDGLCNEINRFKWVRDEPGKQMYFVGGIHETSPVQDTEIDALLGNQGSWSPNTVPMYDDGTNGDVAPGDNIWTITFDLPRGLRMGYKYTWGQKGDLWTGSEEWPGNQRLAEIVDVNGDGFFYRRDNFGDEATNKDLANLRISTGGTVDFTTDGDGDGIFDPRERHDLDNDCRPDPLTTPTGVGPATVQPNSDGTCPERQ